MQRSHDFYLIIQTGNITPLLCYVQIYKYIIDLIEITLIIHIFN